MTITTKNRSQLKSYFVKNAVPTQANFADMIDAPLNQSDDGVFKLPNEPLAVVAAPGEQRRVLRFYSTYPSAAPDWQVSLSPAADPANPASVKPGFGVTDGFGNTRLYIDPKSGHLGLGTTAPVERLDVAGNIKANRFVGENSLTLGDYQVAKPASNVYLWSPPGDRDAWIYLDRGDANSNWGLYHRQIDSPVKGLPANSIGFVGGGNSALKAYVSLQDGSAMFAGPLSVDGIATLKSSLAVLGGATVGTAEARGQTALRVYNPSKPDTWCGRISAGGDNNAVVLGEVNTGAVIGAHNSALNAWADLTINPHGGSVGIRVAKPEKLLDVGGDTQIRGAVSVDGNGTIKSVLAVLGSATVGTSEGRGQTALRVYNPSKPATWCGRISAGGDSNAVVLGEWETGAVIGAHNSALNAWADLTINPGGGSVGIRVAKPEKLLDVGGDAQFRGSVIVQGAIEVKGQLRAGSQLVHQRPLYGVGGDAPLSYTSANPGVLLFNQIMYGPFGYGAPGPAPGATRKWRIYAVYSDNMTNSGDTEVQISLATNWTEDGSGGVYVFKLPRTWGDPAFRRDGASDFITGNIPGHHGFVRIRTNVGGTTGRLYYLALQAWDFFS